MCSDGLSDLVDNDTIATTMLATRGNAQAACEELIKLANGNGGKDNVSVIVAQVDDTAEDKTSKLSSVVNWLFKH